MEKPNETTNQIQWDVIGSQHVPRSDNLLNHFPLRPSGIIAKSQVHIGILRRSPSQPIEDCQPTEVLLPVFGYTWLVILDVGYPTSGTHCTQHIL